jgi:hypothetical protein
MGEPPVEIVSKVAGGAALLPRDFEGVMNQIRTRHELVAKRIDNVFESKEVFYGIYEEFFLPKSHKGSRTF